MIDSAKTLSLLNLQRTAVLNAISAMEHDFLELVASIADSNIDDEHDPEGATIAFERAQFSARLDDARRLLVAIDQAIEKLVDGHYGSCEICGATIAEARLLALPTVRTCYRCATTHQKPSSGIGLSGS